MSQNRMTPESLDAEQATLGACLMDRSAASDAAELLAPNDFYRENHKPIFTAVISLLERGETPDIFAVAEELRMRDALESVGGAEYLSALHEACASARSVHKYAQIVLDKSEARALIAAAGEIQSRCYAGTESLAVIKAEAEQLILGASRDRVAGDCVAVKGVAGNVIANLESQMRNRGKIIGHSTGFAELDRKMGGFRANHLVVLGARPGMGKSAFALQNAYAVARSGLPALVFEFEMSKEELVQRLACNVARVDSQKMERGLLSDAEIGAVIGAAREIERVPLFIQDTPEMTTFDMRSRARRIEAQHGQIGLIVVDYLQIVASARKGRSGSRADELGEIARQLHVMGGEQNCTVLALAQLSREVERREDKRPMLSDLRDSGSIEAEANRVLFLYREGYCRKGEEAHEENGHIQPNRNDWKRAAGDDDSIAEVIIAKNRNGPNGTVRLKWTGASVRFDNLALDDSSGSRAA